MPPRSSSPICERSLDLTLIGIGRRDIPQCSSKHFHMEAFYRTFSDGHRPRSLVHANRRAPHFQGFRTSTPHFWQLHINRQMLSSTFIDELGYLSLDQQTSNLFYRHLDAPQS